MAANVSTRGVMMLLRGSLTRLPVERRTPSAPKAVRAGRACRTSAIAPAAARVDAEVPPKLTTVRPPLSTVVQKAPGASRERFVFESEKHVTRSGTTGWSVQPLGSLQRTRVDEIE